MQKVYYANFNQRKTEVIILISLTVHIRAKKSTQDRKGHYMRKGQSSMETQE